MSVLRITLFGKFEVWGKKRVLSGFDIRKVQKLFCYILLHRDRPHPREALATLLSADPDTDQPTRAFRKTLWQLRNALDSDNISLSNRILLVEPEWLQINPEIELWLDVNVFEEIFNQVQGVRGRALDPPSVQTLQSAVDLYRGGLQESWYQDWYLYERERFQHMYLIILDKLMGYCEAQDAYEAGLNYGACILRCEKASERTHQRMMRLHFRAGDRTAALRQYKRCVQVLNDELGVEPSARSVALYHQIRADQLGDPNPISVEAVQTPPAATSPPPDALGRLKQLQRLLEEAHRQVAQEIRQVELNLARKSPLHRSRNARETRR